MADKMISPDFIFESSWEVCNKIGGIYTVLSTRAKTLQDSFKDKIVFIGPDVWMNRENPLFIEDKKLWTSWVKKATGEGLHIRVGRWNIPGQPYVILVDFTPYFEKKNEIYGHAWNDFQVDSLHAYGDYDEASMFAYAAAKVVESFYSHSLTKKKNVVYQVHEWMTCLGALYIKKYVPQIATIFTTHATSIGRSIAGNHKPLYDYLWAYNGCQMAQELNMESKHSIERQTAHNVDCFTTVSDVTANECKELLDKECDAVLMNGFEQDFVPSGAKFTTARNKARKQIFRIANALIGTEFTDDTLVVATSGRYEYKNKGIDVFLEAMYRGLYEQNLQRPVLALVQVPGWMDAPRADLQDRLKHDMVYDTPLIDPLFTHTLHNQENDNVLNYLHSHGIRNNKESQVKVIFVPCYLDGKDGIFNMPYYDLLIGNDLAVYPSYYEPWGYTPLEATAFHVPCITTSLSGFGLWANKEMGHQSKIQDGVEVITRNDYNFNEVVDNIVSTIAAYSALDSRKQNAIRKKAASLSEKALWKHFIQYYFEAYNIALRNRNQRLG
ncbi:MAG: glycogen/starch synthase [Bacteroidaceae bacterium]|nr:glycogen/starch synthase [Bacteroidaceae bacterium]MBR1903112.1 glycogen/starch synthase [Bacteroidaceae bacterium]